MNNEERFSQAKSFYDQAMEKVKNDPEPKGQQFPNGSRVYIIKDLGISMSHFESDVGATVVHTYAHAFGGDDVTSYCLDVDGYGEISWYKECQLIAI